VSAQFKEECMNFRDRLVLAAILLGLAGTQTQGQTPGKNPTPAISPPARNIVAAKVNGDVIPELAIYRVMAKETGPDREQMRKDILNVLIGNLLIDQYLSQIKVTVDSSEIEKNLAQMRQEAKVEGKSFGEILNAMYLTEDELRHEVTCNLRWLKFAATRATEKNLRVFFEKNKSMFDGSQVQARHILVNGSDAPARNKALAIKRQIESGVAAELAKLPAGTDKLEREKARAGALVKLFAEAASRESTCPSKKEGGYLGWFPRNGTMVEPFAKAAFALKPFEMSEPVLTEFGYHLILAIDVKPGRDMRFEEVLPIVREVYYDRLREAMINHLKPKAQITINPGS
jgi:peptidyl-prolyl cis-trans isomerase C